MLRLEESECRPLTAMQTSMVLASMRDPQSGVYIVQDVCETGEALDSALLQRAWRVVAARHPALRTRIETRAGEPVGQRVQQGVEIPWHGEDGQLAEFLPADRARGFDFAQGVPMRFTVLRTPGGSSTLIWTSHHALLDGASYAIAWREWFEVYEVLGRGDEVRLPAANSFTAHLDWLDRQDFTAAQRYWREHLAGVSHTTGYIVDRLRLADSAGGDDVARGSATCSPELTGRIQEFARRHEVTAGTLVQCAWGLLLSRYSGMPEVVFGVTRAGRRSPTGAANMVGLLINTLPFRMAAPPDAPVLPWLKQVREQVLATREHEHTPLSKLREWNILPPGMAPFDSLFVYEHERPADTMRKLGGNWRRRTLTRVQRTDSPLTLAAYGEPLLSLDVIYDTRLYCRDTIAGIAGHLEALLRSFVEQPHGRLRELNMLSRRERKWLVEERNQTATAYATDLCAHQLFEREAEGRPAAVALDDAGRSISFEQLNRQSNQLAGLLRERGAGPEDFVGVCMDRSPEAVIAVIAVLKAGAAFALLSPDLPAERLASMLQDARPKLLITTEGHATKLTGCGCEVLILERVEAAIARQSPSNLPCIAKPENAAYAAFTSGSTGRPKGAVITHRALANYAVAVARAYGVSCADRRLQFGAIGSDTFVSEIFTYLGNGASLVFCLDPAGNSIAEFLRRIEAHRITITGLPASWWSEWVAAISGGGLAMPPSLRAVIVAMERMNPAALIAWRRATEDRIRLFNAYGPTETAPVVTVYEAGTSRWEGASMAPIGKPIANIRVYVLDDHRNPVPVGVPGELYIGGDGVGRGYLNAPELTAARFVPDPYGADPGKRLFRTGDIVFSLPDGNLVFVGRVDRQVKIRGFRVEPEEIEAVLAQYPGVRQCAVIVQDDGVRQSLAAYLTAWKPPGPAPEELRLHLSRRLPDYMLPAVFTTLAEMPMTATGKIDRRLLPQHAPRTAQPEHFDAPATATEKRLAGLWQDALGLARVSATANFFESGGDSLRATHLVVRIQEEFGKEFPFALFLRAPTIAQVALALDGNASGAPDMLFYGRPGSRVPLFCITSRPDDLYVFRHLTKHLDSAQPVFVLNAPVRDGEGFERVEQLAARVCESVRNVRTQGPYILGGYCFGGILAFEAAQQLISGGAEVRLVALFDTPTPGYPRILRSRRRYWDVIRENGPGVCEVVAHAKTVGRLMGRKTWARAQSSLASAGIAPAVAPATDGASLLEIAARMYIPKPIDADIVQLIAQDQPVGSRVLEDPRLGWRDLCRGRFQLYKAPGDHVTWLQEPHAQTTAALLSEALVALH
ncbi:MAG: amino acid adenylation domain-containing protein [Bryobacteraceae bacterium]